MNIKPIKTKKDYKEALKRIEALWGVGRSRKSEILSGKRKLSLNMIRALHKKLKIPAESLINPY